MLTYRKQVLVFILAFLLYGCASTRPPGEVNIPVAPTSGAGVDESFDPVSLNDEDLRFPSENSATSTAGGSNTPAPREAMAEEQAPRGRIDGFQVQLYASKDVDKANLEKKEAEFVFAEDGVRVYIEFDSPMYKVRIGDCATREAAEELRELARSRGYATSWIVKAKINAARSTGN